MNKLENKLKFGKPKSQLKTKSKKGVKAKLPSNRERSHDRKAVQPRSHHKLEVNQIGLRSPEPMLI